MNKRRRNMNVTGVCTVCGLESEDMAHMCFRCPHAVAFWQAMREVWVLPKTDNFLGPREKWLEELLLSLSKDTCDKVLMILWRIWFVRNEITHSKPMPDLEGSRRFIYSYMTSLINLPKSSTEEMLKGKKPVDQSMYNQSSTIAVTPKICSWLRPPAGLMKLNVDGSFMDVDGTAGAGMILRAHDGTIALTACRSLRQCSSALEAELCAFMEGVALASGCTQQQIIIETDSVEVLRMVKSKERDYSPMGHIVEEVKGLLVLAHVADIVKIPRSQNVASHLLAGYGRLNNRTDVWLGSGPDSILDSLLRDCNNSYI
jgi:hypothetical protein